MSGGKTLAIIYSRHPHFTEGETEAQRGRDALTKVTLSVGGRAET